MFSTQITKKNKAYQDGKLRLVAWDLFELWNELGQKVDEYPVDDRFRKRWDEDCEEFVGEKTVLQVGIVGWDWRL